MGTWFNRVVCRLWRGHAFVRATDPRRLYLRCQHCGFESPGWEIVAVRRIRIELP